MRSNYREIPEFLALMKNLGIYEVAFTTMETNARNLAREPGLVNEVIKDPKEVHELYSILQQAMAEERPHFRKCSGTDYILSLSTTDSTLSFSMKRMPRYIPITPRSLSVSRYGTQSNECRQQRIGRQLRTSGTAQS